MAANDGSNTFENKRKKKILGRLEYNMIGQHNPFLKNGNVYKCSQFIFKPLLDNYIDRTTGM